MMNETQQEQRLQQVRADIAYFVEERALAREQLRKVQSAFRRETKLLEAAKEIPNDPSPDNSDVKTESPSRKRPRTEESTSQENVTETDGKQEDSASPTELSENRPKDQSEDHEEVNESAAPEPPAKRPKVDLDDSTKKRTAKLFGHLMGHLKKAKARLDSERDTKAAELQLETARRVQEKLEKGKAALTVARLQTLKETEAALKEKLRHIQWEISCRETLSLRYQLELHYTHMQGFIKTAAEPTLFWIPRVHNKESRLLQQETGAQIEKKIRSLQEQLKPLTYEEWKATTTKGPEVATTTAPS
eukprot:Blabericola_migrator_1__8484@NODE_4423_length_1168_cov_164_445958_g2735_i0_p1_GENE_NODE_4423_length_1168_cov_164_445958_g2735_i0NODE_4423_length_1168_cov_164_445958_g2735_i0_p1_ORF_typecomplete_len304_score74_45Pinin_SDK_memA/PF04696_13/1_8e04Pinin_SDK_memA/PF04696_13/2_6e17GIT_CC/PF16559_5/1_8e03GIT_CC/PF16559_5/1_9GIT_CC/PF16559_5/5Hamartin/PF04388_12/1_6RSB_motif/PF16294_5/1_8e04RSB_motif/PF16294_5/3_3e03RSB_motif/PF16294_5/3_4_NODE_4423_length_1168_cov_164_445958_g2735_i01511062